MNLQKLRNKFPKPQKEVTLLDKWHYLMIHYGWISWNEFIKEDNYRIDELIKRLNKMNEERSKQGGRKR